jgi:hypothetical protein
VNGGAEDRLTTPTGSSTRFNFEDGDTGELFAALDREQPIQIGCNANATGGCSRPVSFSLGHLTMMTSQQLHSAMDSVRRYERVFCTLGLAALFAAIWIPSACSSLHWRWLDDRSWIVELVMWCWLPGVFFFVFGGIWFTVKWHGLLCPHCGKPLTTRYPIVLATGKCSHCERSVVDAVA